MLENPDLAVVVRFAREDRTTTPALLASAGDRLMGYGIAKIFGDQKVRVNTEGRRLVAAGVAKKRVIPEGRTG